MDSHSIVSEDARRQAESYVEACGEYTSEFERQKIIENWAVKESKGDGLVEDFRRRAGNPEGARILEVGFGSGFYLIAFARAGAESFGLEVNEVLCDIARKNFRERNLHAVLRQYDGVHFPYPDNYFDFVYMVSVLEHVSHPRSVVAEVSRVLKPGGKFYVSFPNRFAPRETHSGVWLISYLPLHLAEWVYKHLLKRNTVAELNLHFLSYWSLKRFIRGTALSIVYEDTTGLGIRRALKRTLKALGIHHSAILKTVMVVMEKKAR